MERDGRTYRGGEKQMDGQTERETDGRSERQRGAFIRNHSVLSRDHIPFQIDGTSLKQRHWSDDTVLCIYVSNNVSLFLTFHGQWLLKNWFLGFMNKLQSVEFGVMTRYISVNGHQKLNFPFRHVLVRWGLLSRHFEGLLVLIYEFWEPDKWL